MGDRRRYDSLRALEEPTKLFLGNCDSSQDLSFSIFDNFPVFLIPMVLFLVTLFFSRPDSTEIVLFTYCLSPQPRFGCKFNKFILQLLSIM